MALKKATTTTESESELTNDEIQAIRDKLGIFIKEVATPPTTNEASQITIKLDNTMGKDFTGLVTDIETFVVDSANIVEGANEIYKFKTNSEPTVSGATKLGAVSSDFKGQENMYLIINKQADGVKYNIILA